MGHSSDELHGCMEYRDCDTHSLSLPRNSLRNAGQKKGENQLFFCTTFRFVEMPFRDRAGAADFNRTHTCKRYTESAAFSLLTSNQAKRLAR